jgi:hypothetical protein
MNAINLNMRVFTLSRIPDYNDLFNVAAVIVGYDLSSTVRVLTFPLIRHERRSSSSCGQAGLNEALRWAKEARSAGRHNLIIAAIGLRKDLVTVRGDLFHPLSLLSKCHLADQRTSWLITSSANGMKPQRRSR